MNNEKIRSFAMWVMIGVLGLSVFGGYALAGDEFSWEDVEDKVASLLAGKVPDLGGFLGASGTRFPNGVSADTTSPEEGEVRGTTLTITATSTGGNFVNKGSVLSTTTMGTATTFNENDFLYYNFISATANVTADHTFKFPASSTLTSFLPNAGDSKRIFLRNVTTTVGTDYLFSSNVGVFLEYSSTTPRTIFASSTAILDFTRQVNSDVTVSISTFGKY